MDAHCLVIHKLNNACQATRVNPSRNLQLIVNIFRTLWRNSDSIFLAQYRFSRISQIFPMKYLNYWIFKMLLKTCNPTLLCEVTINSIGKCFVFFFHPHLHIKSKTSSYTIATLGWVLFGKFWNFQNPWWFS